MQVSCCSFNRWFSVFQEVIPSAAEVVEDSTTLGEHSKIGLHDFQLLRVIGRGSYAKVLQVEHHRTKRIYAMKVIKKELVTDEEASECGREEGNGNSLSGSRWCLVGGGHIQVCESSDYDWNSDFRQSKVEIVSNRSPNHMPAYFKTTNILSMRYWSCCFECFSHKGPTDKAHLQEWHNDKMIYACISKIFLYLLHPWQVLGTEMYWIFLIFKNYKHIAFLCNSNWTLCVFWRFSCDWTVWIAVGN